MSLHHSRGNRARGQGLFAPRPFLSAALRRSWPHLSGSRLRRVVPDARATRQSPWTCSLEAYRCPKAQAKRQALAQTMGAEGVTWVRAVYAPTAPAALRGLPTVACLRQSGLQKALPTAAGVTWHDHDTMPLAAHCVSFPSAPDAHDARQHPPQWGGYQVHLTATWDDGLPPLITHVETPSAPVDDRQVTAQLHAALREKALRPSRPMVDTGYLDAERLATSQRDDGLELWGPTRQDVRWQAHSEGGFAVRQCVLNGDQQYATWPADHTSISGSPAMDKRVNEGIKMPFARTAWRPCLHRSNVCAHSGIPAARSPSDPANHTTPSRRPESANPPRPLRRHMPDEPVWRGRCRMASVPVADAARAISAGPRLRSNMS
jgi:hypothetical protein